MAIESGGSADFRSQPKHKIVTNPDGVQGDFYELENHLGLPVYMPVFGTAMYIPESSVKPSPYADYPEIDDNDDLDKAD